VGEGELDQVGAHLDAQLHQQISPVGTEARHGLIGV
jgi:hypothetical protein